MGVVFNRVFAMPNHNTFMIKPIGELVRKYLVGAETIIDPFARNSDIGTITNDMDRSTSAMHHYEAVDFIGIVRNAGIEADAVLMDPPYSPRQISESYKGVGMKVHATHTQSSFYTKVKDALDGILKTDGIAITCGWNSGGFGVVRGYELLEVLLVNHGGAHNDTIVTVEIKRRWSE